MKTGAHPPSPVLVVDDEESVVHSLSMILKSHGIDNVVGCVDAREVLELIRDREPELVLLDLSMPHVSGQDLLVEIREKHPQVPVIVVTATNDVDAAVECMKCGASDYMVKAVEENRLVSGVRRAIEIRELRRECDELKARMLAPELTDRSAFSQVVTRSPRMLAIFRYVEAVAPSSEPVLIVGETGTGKELVARAVHAASRRSGAFVAVNVAGLDDNVFSDTLFGHRKGAFTDASSSREGLVQQAAAGTLFLDEIGDLSPQSQVKLLRLLDAREYLPLGSDFPRRSDARVVLATNRKLEEMLQGGAFRQDLYFRLSTHEVHLPPLRDRREDLPLLVEHFLGQAVELAGRGTPRVPARLFSRLETYDFPGNIRELRKMIFDAVARAGPEGLSPEAFPSPQVPPIPPGGSEERSTSLLFTDRLPSLREAKDLLIDEALQRTGRNQSAAARLLGITHQALSKWLQRHPRE